ncbi:MAG: radical SAM protein [Desulfobacteraceae bacterium]|nr:radical SAM protein [Desulfobacteraceae bacterium]MDH3575244.1 radical SAM protein [Desulfobacteraceae bacterium]MDH3723841.1 radical SAM protein [Desulfobacteraceae bacterium]MDH3874931.1 radical SAM protein [Desulfobacteraceae bacterium]PLX45221.1 MAG: radical SAM protein [Desulfobacteraceae bacterium]
MQYKGPIYRPPSEADSLLIQATVGCPHNKCTFCMVYKNGPGYKVRDMKDIKADILRALDIYGDHVRTLFLPAGNTIAMKTDDLCEILIFAKETFSTLGRITVYGSSQYIHKKGPQGLKRLADAGLSRIHVGLESGDDIILKRIKKGTSSKEQIEAGRWVMDAGMELSLYVVLGIGGKDRTDSHARETAKVLNEIVPDFIRLRTFVPKINTGLLAEVQNGSFQMLSPHEVLREAALLITKLRASSYLASDHYTNYINLEGKFPEEKKRLLDKINIALKQEEASFRPFFIGTQ